MHRLSYVAVLVCIGLGGACRDGGADDALDDDTGDDPEPAEEWDDSAEGGEADGDEWVDAVEVRRHDHVNTILVVTWDQRIESESVWLEFTFENGEVMGSRPSPGTLGPHQDVVLGVPESSSVRIRVVQLVDGVRHVSSDLHSRTGAAPSSMPRPSVSLYDPQVASEQRWLLGAVEDSPCSRPSGCYYRAVFWTYIVDRKGRIVWYYADPANKPTSSFQRIARDGEYLVIEKRHVDGNPSNRVLKLTLDWEYFEEVEVPGFDDCIDVTTDGSILYNVRGQSNALRELTADGRARTIWDCSAHFGSEFLCYSNTVNWNPIHDTVLMSFPYANTVVEVDRQSGALVGQYGDAPGSWGFSPDSWEFEFQHFANITPEGTLLVSSHMPGYQDTTKPVAGQHAFIEFEIDRVGQRLVERWVYNDGPEWAAYKGMAIRMENGNTLANYGTGGVIREITPDEETAFYMKFDLPDDDDFFNKMVGHNEFIDDLYALNSGPD